MHTSYTYIISSLAIHLLVGTKAASMSAVANNVAVKLRCMYFFKLVFSFFLDIYTGVELPDHMVVLFLVFGTLRGINWKGARNLLWSR